MDENTLTSVFRWKAAVSTYGSSPIITGNLLLGCINVETVGIKHQKVSKHNICRWCGNPWGSGDLSISIKKTAKTNQIKKFLKKNSKNQGDLKKLNNFQKRMLERYTKTPSSLLIKCKNCLKTTICNIPLPPKSELTSKKQVVNTNSTAANTNSASSKKKKNKQQQKQNAQSAKKSLATIKSSGKSKKPLSKSQLKNIAKGIKNNASAANQSSLQKFLNSVK